MTVFSPSNCFQEKPHATTAKPRNPAPVSNPDKGSHYLKKSPSPTGMKSPPGTNTIKRFLPELPPNYCNNIKVFKTYGCLSENNSFSANLLGPFSLNDFKDFVVDLPNIHFKYHCSSSKKSL